MQIKKLYYSLCLISALFATFTSALFADIIILKSGKTVEGKIIQKTAEYVKIDFQGVELTYFMDEIERIEGEKAPAELKNVISPPVGPERNPEQLFNEVAPAIVVINTQSPRGGSLGSGFIVDASGVIVTNFHVVKEAEAIEVKLKDGRSFPVKGIVYYDARRDVCILKIDSTGLPVVSLGDSGTLRLGQKVLVIGAPLGLEYSISDGLFSGKRVFSNLESLQFTAPISPGNSGGPLLDMHGNVLGITTFMLLQGQNLNFAVPINEIKPFIGIYPKIDMQEFSSRVSKAEILWSQGNEALYAGNTEVAINYFQQALEINPNDVIMRSDLGGFLSMLGRMDEAIIELKKAILVDPNHALAHMNLGVAYMKKGMLDESMSELKRAVALNPNDAVSHDNLGATYARKSMLDESIIEHKKAIALDSSYFLAYSNLSFAYAQKGMYQEALEAAKKALSFNPNDGQTNNNLACSYFALGQYDLAIEYCDKAIKLGYPVDPQFIEMLKPYRKAGTTVSKDEIYTKKELEALSKTDEEAKSLAYKAMDIIQNGEYDLAVEYSRKALSRIPRWDPAYSAFRKIWIYCVVGTGINYNKKGLFDDARKRFKEAISLIGSSEDLFLREQLAHCYVQLGDGYLRQGDKEKAQEYLEKLTALNTPLAIEWARDFASDIERSRK